jgi:hypothetical protein
MTLLGVDDVASAERARMAADPLARAVLGKAIGDALQSLTLAGASLEGAAATIGIEGDDLRALMTPSAFATEPPPAPGQPPQNQNGNSGGRQPPTPGTPPAARASWRQSERERRQQRIERRRRQRVAPAVVERQQRRAARSDGAANEGEKTEDPREDTYEAARQEEADAVARAALSDRSVRAMRHVSVRKRPNKGTRISPG